VTSTPGAGPPTINLAPSNLFPRIRFPRSVIFVLLALVTSLPLHAQVNIERLRQDDFVGWGGSFNADVTWRNGNVDLFVFGLAARLDYARARARTFFVANGDLGWQGGERFSNEALAHWRGIYRPTERVWPEAFVQINYDKSRLLEFRFLSGGGVRIGLISSESVQVAWGTGYMFEHEALDLVADADHPDYTNVHRWSNYLSARLEISPQASLVIVTYAQPQIDDFGDTRVLNDTRFGVDVTEVVSLVTTFRFNLDTRLPDGIEEVDTNLKAGMGLTF
jgi:hypothetical protein